MPAPGAVLDVVHTKLPAGVAEPPLKVELAKVWPYVIAEAVGHVVTVGVASFTVTLAVPMTVV